MKQQLRKSLDLDILDIINALPFYVIIVDTSHTILEANQAVYTHLGVKPEDIIGKYCPLIIHGTDHPFEGCPLEEAAGKDVAIERDLLDKKTGRWVRSSVFPIKKMTPDGKRAYLHMVADITQQKQAEEQLKDSHERLRRLSSHLESVREEEKKKIARDLHDETSQLLASLNAHLQAAFETLPVEAHKTQTLIKRSQELSLQILDELHKLIYDLRPALLDELGLLPAISSLADSHLREAGIKFNLKTSGQVSRLSPDLEITLFRVIQETFTNIVKHARASRVQINMDFRKAKLKITIKDNGRGFDVNEVNLSKTRPRGLGLLNMEERIKLVDGSWLIHSAPGSGTQITIEVPLKKSEGT